MDAPAFINMIKKIPAVFFIFFWLCVSVYFGTGGYNYIKIKQDEEKAQNSGDTVQVFYDNINYRNRAAMVADMEKTATVKLYPIIEPLPSPVWHLITIFAFGIMGSVVHLLKQIALENKKVEDVKYVSFPLLGMITGFIIIGLSYVVPSTMATSDIELKPMSLIFLSLFSGFFSAKFYEFLGSIFSRIFTAGDKKDG